MLSKLFKLKLTPLLGLDISSDAIRLLEISHNNDIYQIEAYSVVPLLQCSRVEHTISIEKQVANAISKAVHYANTSCKLAAISLPSSSVITRIFQVNISFTENEILEQIELEADRYLPYPLTEAYYDFEILPCIEHHPNLREVLLVAAKVETVESRLAIMVEAGLKTTIIDIESFAIERAFNFLLSELPEMSQVKHTALFDIGSQISTLHVFKQGCSIYHRSQEFGLKQLQDELDRRYGLSPDKIDAVCKASSVSESHIQEVLESFKEAVVQQLQRALQTFFSAINEHEIQILFLSGVGLSIKSLADQMEDRLAIKTMIVDPFAKMKIAPGVDAVLLREDAPSLMLVLGLALRTLEK